MPAFWTAQRDGRLRDLIMQGETADRIAVLMGTKNSRAIYWRASVLQVPLGKARHSQHATINRQSESERNLRAQRRATLQRQLRGRKSPSSIDELQAIAAASQLPVTKLPAGTHCGWKPSWA